MGLGLLDWRGRLYAFVSRYWGSASLYNYTSFMFPSVLFHEFNTHNHYGVVPSFSSFSNLQRSKLVACGIFMMQNTTRGYIQR